MPAKQQAIADYERRLATMLKEVTRLREENETLREVADLGEDGRGREIFDLRAKNDLLESNLKSAEADAEYYQDQCEQLENRHDDRIDELEWALELEARRLTQAWRRITELQQQRATT